MPHANVLDWLEEVAQPEKTAPAARTCRVRFEELTTMPAETLAAMCTAIGISYDPAMLRPYDDAANVELHSAAGEAGVASRDPKLMRHSQISGANADAWRRHAPRRALSVPDLNPDSDTNPNTNTNPNPVPNPI